MNLDILVRPHNGLFPKLKPVALNTQWRSKTLFVKQQTMQLFSFHLGTVYFTANASEIKEVTIPPTDITRDSAPSLCMTPTIAPKKGGKHFASSNLHGAQRPEPTSYYVG